MGLAHVRESVDPVAPFRLPSALPDGVLRRRDGVFERIAAHDGEVVLLRAARPDPDGPVVLGAWAPTTELAELGLARWRRTLGVDFDHRPFLDMAWDDPMLGPLVRRRPWLRPAVRYRPHEALIAAICGQLIEYVEALKIERGLVRLAGVRCERTGLRDAATPEAILALAPAQIERLGLSARRTLVMRETCRLLVRGLDLEADDPEQRELAWARLRAVPGLGAWTLSSLALRGQGYPDASPSGDLGLLKNVGRLTYDGVAPRDRIGRTPLATEQEVHDLVTQYSPWRGYAAEHLFLAFMP
jgi:3-methyladenine DNA glycosylase/8-oxoguanine DNA glycosylase